MEQIKARIDRAAQAVITVFEWITRVLLVFTILLITAQVVARAVFNYSIIWAEEVSLICFIYITFFTMAIAMRYDLHLRVELGVAWLPKGGRRVVEFVDNVLLLGVSVLMLIAGIHLTKYGVASIMPATRWPTSVIYLPTPIAGCLCTLHQVLRLLGIAKSETAKQFIERGNPQ